MAPGSPGARQAVARVRGIRRVSLDSGTWRDRYAAHRLHTVDERGEALERGLSMRRGEDLAANDPHAASVVGSMATNVVGTGLRPQSQVHHTLPGVGEDACNALENLFEAEWALWCAQAHAGERAHFDDLQFMAITSVLTKGEFLFLPRRIQRAWRTFSLFLQDVHPARLSTPCDLSLREELHDGVETDATGLPLAYWISNPLPLAAGALAVEGLGSASYTRIPARRGPWRNVLHGFPYRDEEQFRGRSVFGPGMKFFRSLTDSLDYELVAQIIAASFPVFLETVDPAGTMGTLGRLGNPHRRPGGEAPAEAGAPTWRPSPGLVVAGRPGERPHVLQSNRPGSNFDAFAHLILRASAASTGMPYEVLAKDFSKTNYSSARAALNEAWKVFRTYRQWLVRGLCDPVWAMVIEESYLLGRWTEPPGAPEFYSAPHLYLDARWVGPSRGYVDPEKEIGAILQRVAGGVSTLADEAAEQGGDWEAILEQRARETRRAEALGVELVLTTAGRPGRPPQEPQEKEGHDAD